MKEDTDEIPMKPTFTLPLLKCDYDSTGACYVIFDKTDFPITSFTNTLKFTMLEVEEDIQVDDGYEDEYMIEDIDLLVGDYIQPLYGDWSRLWADLEHEFIETYSLSAVSTLQGNFTINE